MKLSAHKIPKNILKISPISSSKFVILVSAIACVATANNLYDIVNIASFIIGAIHIPITTIIPTIPTAFFNIIPHPNTVSTASPNILPTTGIAELTIAFVVFAVTPSTLLVNVPSKDTIPTNIVKTIPKNHTIPDFKNLESLST